MFRTIFFMTLVFGQLAFSQSTGSIYGTITDGNAPGEPLLFANISLKAEDITVQTDFYGNFEIAGLTPGNYALEISYMGYERKQVAIEVKSGKACFVQEALQSLSLQTESLMLSAATTSEGNSADETVRQ